MSQKIEKRIVPNAQVELRDDNGKTKITGYAAVFGLRSENLGGFVEVVTPGAFDRTLKAGADVRALVNHDSSQIIGRSKSGTLTMRVDAHGLAIEIDPPDTQAGRDIVTSIRRGDVTGMSFAFTTRSDSWRQDDGLTVRDLLDVDLFDVCPVTYPAYPDTSVAVRSLEAWQTESKPAYDPDEYESLRRDLAASGF